jgi:hypothetical protein
MLNRDGLVAELFVSLDEDADGRLSMNEFRMFADLTGFKGGDHTWAEAFLVLCAERNVDPAVGFGVDDWTKLICDEDEENACFCSNSEIVRITLLKKCEDMVKGDEAKQDPLQYCSKGHGLHVRTLGVLEGRVNPSKCSVCCEVILRKEPRYSCKTCRYNVCRSCRDDPCSSDVSSTDVPSSSDGELSATPEDSTSLRLLGGKVAAGSGAAAARHIASKEQWSSSLRNLQNIQAL